MGSAEARFDGRNGLKRLVGRGGGERRGDQKSEGGPEIIDTILLRMLRILFGLRNKTFTSASGKGKTYVVLDKIGKHWGN